MPRYMFMVSMDVDPDQEALFNEVYDAEHVPNLLKVPGVHAARRIKAEPSVRLAIAGEEKLIDHAAPAPPARAKPAAQTWATRQRLSRGGPTPTLPGAAGWLPRRHAPLPTRVSSRGCKRQMALAIGGAGAIV